MPANARIFLLDTVSVAGDILVVGEITSRKSRQTETRGAHTAMGHTRDKGGRPKGSVEYTLDHRMAAKALLSAGLTTRETAKRLRISRSTVGRIAQEHTYDPAAIERLKVQMLGKYLTASDRFLGRALSQSDSMSGYHAMLCSGISHDHYLRGMRGEAPSMQININIPGCVGSINPAIPTTSSDRHTDDEVDGV